MSTFWIVVSVISAPIAIWAAVWEWKYWHPSNLEKTSRFITSKVIPSPDDSELGSTVLIYETIGPHKKMDARGMRDIFRRFEFDFVIEDEVHLVLSRPKQERSPQDRLVWVIDNEDNVRVAHCDFSGEDPHFDPEKNERGNFFAVKRVRPKSVATPSQPVSTVA